ncbi:MAG: hypothetical protein CMA67_01200, partial [Euryarchaeota archaeon]|nr:hypothetical protein [Euryarchaeota archaeon]
MEDDDLAVVVLPTYLDFLQDQDRPSESGHANASHSQNSLEKSEELAIVILPDYLEQHESIIQPPPPPIE